MIPLTIYPNLRDLNFKALVVFRLRNGESGSKNTDLWWMPNIAYIAFVISYHFHFLYRVTPTLGERQSLNTRQQKLPGCPSLMWLQWTLVLQTRNSALILDQSATCKPQRKPDSFKNKIKNSQKRRKFHMDLNLCLFLSIISKTIFVSVKKKPKKALNQKK